MAVCTEAFTGAGDASVPKGFSILPLQIGEIIQG
jgi:hypothetical protein